MALVAKFTAAALKDAYDSGDIGRTYRADNHRDDRRL
jgi:hypothetical protein